MQADKEGGNLSVTEREYKSENNFEKENDFEGEHKSEIDYESENIGKKRFKEDIKKILIVLLFLALLVWQFSSMSCFLKRR